MGAEDQASMNRGKGGLQPPGRPGKEVGIRGKSLDGKVTVAIFLIPETSDIDPDVGRQLLGEVLDVNAGPAVDMGRILVGQK
jgi:hypothetical protein